MSERWPEGSAIRERLSGLGFAWVEAAKVVASTNDLGLEAARRGEPGPGAVVAREQQAGRGARGRSWASPPGGLWLTLVLAAPAARLLPWLGLGAGAAGALAIREACGVAAGVKWPNDILAGGGKLGGVLVETAAGRAVVGIGLNANNTAPLPEARSLRELAGRPVELAALAGEVAGRVLECHRLLAAGQWQAVRAQWSSLDALAGQWAVVETQGGVREVKCLGITARGTLACQERDGSQCELAAGSRLRPACLPG